MSISHDLPDCSLATTEKIWVENRCIKESSIGVYKRWINRFLRYCEMKSIDFTENLTLKGVREFSSWYSEKRSIAYRPVFLSSRSAIGSSRYALKLQNITLPEWEDASSNRCTLSPIQREFAEFIATHRGSPTVTVNKKTKHIRDFMHYLRERKKRIQRLNLKDIDNYTKQCSERYSRATVSDICSTLRLFCRFLMSTGRLSTDLSLSIVSPKYVPLEKPHRTLPWDDVCKILNSIDRQADGGYRDYALLLMMASYGMGSGEIINLSLDSINWTSCSIQVTRPKTKISFNLPLLTPIADAIIDYLRYGRPPHTKSRRLFVTLKVPHKPLACSTTIRHIFHKHAKNANVTAEYMGTHVLRHTHACRQMALGTDPKLIGDILGHQNTESTTAYLRVSIEHLRHLSLEVPL